MLDRHYTDPRLVQTYDALCLPGPDTDFYVRLAGSTPKSVLDLGCGTGRLALVLAAAGHRVTGLDPAAQMLEIARRADTGQRVRWIEGDARSFALDATFDFVMMTGHAFQVLLTDADVGAFLEAARDHLRPDGTLAFETRNPSAREWERWLPEHRSRIEVDGVGTVTHTRRVTEVTGEFVSFDQRYRFADVNDEVTSTSTLRFMDEPSLRRHLEAAGYGEDSVYGYWDGSPVTPSSLELIVVARR